MSIREEIGGYIELELPSGQEYHNDALKFNTGRNAFCFYLLKNNIKEIFIPSYICDSITEVLDKARINYKFYNIDPNFKPLIDPKEVGDTHILLVNYFGICEKIVKESIATYKNVIADHTHAFFSNPEGNTPTFYSPRKFFGVADGGYLYAEGLKNDDMEEDGSAQRYVARLVRIESGSKEGYFIYRNTEQLLSRAKILKMSTLTQNVLASIRYDQVWEKREANFKYLHKNLKKYNKLNINIDSVHGPMIYPFLHKDENLRSYLIENGIFVPHYWPEVLIRVKNDSFENLISANMCGLPIDQRYSRAEMDKIVNLVSEYISAFQKYDETPSSIEEAEQLQS